MTVAEAQSEVDELHQQIVDNKNARLELAQEAEDLRDRYTDAIAALEYAQKEEAREAE